MDEQLRGLIGVPFFNKGRNAVLGMDCWGLVMEVFKRYGMNVPDFTVDSFNFKAIDTLAHEAAGFNTWEEVHRPSDKDAPLVVLVRMHPKLITHAGVFIGHGKIIHTMSMTGVVISRISALRSRITGYYRYIHEEKQVCSK